METIVLVIALAFHIFSTANSVLIVQLRLGASARARYPDVNNPPSSHYEGFLSLCCRGKLLGTCFECDHHRLINTD